MTNKIEPISRDDFYNYRAMNHYDDEENIKLRYLEYKIDQIIEWINEYDKTKT